MLSRKISVAAKTSNVGVSPAPTKTTSGSTSLAQFKIEIPLLQCSLASSILSHCKLGCLEAITTFI